VFGKHNLYGEVTNWEITNKRLQGEKNHFETDSLGQEVAWNEAGLLRGGS